MMKHLLSSVCIGALLLPIYAGAQLTSENFVVEDSAVGIDTVTLTASSSNYTAKLESGGLFQIEVLEQDETGTSFGTRLRQVIEVDADLKSGSTQDAVLIGPRTGKVDEAIEVVLHTDVAMELSVDEILITAQDRTLLYMSVVPLGNGVFLGRYTPTTAGVHEVRAYIRGEYVTADSDGLSDGVLHIPVTETDLLSPGAPYTQQLDTHTESESTSDTQIPVATGDLSEVLYGVTESCHRVFAWDTKEAVSVYRMTDNGADVLMAQILPRMPWFIDVDESVVGKSVQYRLVGADGEQQVVIFTEKNYLACDVRTADVTSLDIDGDALDELYANGLFQDVDGSTVPFAVATDGIIFDTDNNNEPDLFWNPKQGTSTVVSAVDRIFITNASVTSVQTYFPVDVSKYAVGLTPVVKGLVYTDVDASTLVERTPSLQESPLFSLNYNVLLLLLSGAGLLGGLLNALFSLARSPFAIGHISRIFSHGPRLLFSSLVFWRKRKPWGTVYDSMTKAPLDPVLVELFDIHGQKQTDAITDLDGRYGFLVPEGQYELKVRKTNYTFPSRMQNITGKDVLYSNIYFGGPATVADTVVYDVPMDPLDFDWNQFEKMRTKQTHFTHKLDPLIARGSSAFFYLGAGAMLWQYYVSPSLTTGVLLAVYVVLLLIRFFRGKPPLYGVCTKNGHPLPFALIRIMRGSHELMSKVTDSAGRYVALVPKGTYTIAVDERVSADEYITVMEREVSAKKGYININVKL